MLTYADVCCRTRDSQDPQTDAHIETEGGTSPDDVAQGGRGGGGGSRSEGGGRWGVRTGGSGQERCVYVYMRKKKKKEKPKVYVLW